MPTFTGTVGNDLLRGTGGDDVINGDAGNDQLFGEGGNDVITGGEGSDQIQDGAGDDEVYGGNDNDNISSDVAGNDEFYGEGGDDAINVSRFGDVADTILLDGGLGNDRLRFVADNGQIFNVTFIGGEGNDHLESIRASYASMDAGAGDDTVILSMSSGAYEVTLGAGQDQLVLFAYGNGFSTGNAVNVADFEAGDNGDKLLLTDYLLDVLQGWDGNANPFGTGYLRFVQSGADALLQIDRNGGGDAFATLLTLANVNINALTIYNLGYTFLDRQVGSISADTMRGTAGNNAIFGESGDDLLFGFGGQDYLFGGDGDDFIDGGAGADIMTGGLGDDIYYLDDAQDVIVELSSEGLDEVRASVDYTLGDNIENLRLIGVARVGIGSALDNVIFAGAGPTTILGLDGNDTLWASAGADMLEGGNGDDIIYGRNGNDTIEGGNGDDILRGEVGSDLISCGAGDDSAFGGDGIDNISGGDGADILRGETQNDTLFGDAGDDTLQGGEGNDHIYGGAGRDVMNGGEGADNFWFSDGDFAGLTNATSDRIQDFVQGEDRIRLADVDANVLVDGNQAFSFIGTAIFGNVAGQLRYSQSSGLSLIEGDLNGDGVADFSISLAGLVSLSSADFVL